MRKNLTPEELTARNTRYKQNHLYKPANRKKWNEYQKKRYKIKSDQISLQNASGGAKTMFHLGVILSTNK